MMTDVLCLLVIFLTYVYSSQLVPRSISCDEVASPGVIKLNSLFTYHFHFNGEFCIVNDSEKRIIGNGNGSSGEKDSHVSIKCATLNPINSTNGIVFINSTVEIENISFSGCGAYLRSLPHDILGVINSSSPLYSNDLATVFLFINCKVIFRNVHMFSSFGFAIIGFNLKHSLFYHSVFKSDLVTYIASLHWNKAIGSGVLIHFTDCEQLNRQNDVHVHVSKCYFKDNVLYIRSHSIEMTYSKSFISYAAGMTIIYSQKDYQAFANVSDTIFMSNSGPLTSSFLIIQYKGYHNSTTLVSNCRFHKATSFPKADLLSQTLILSDMSFIVMTNDEEYKQSEESSVSTYQYVPLLVEDTVFCELADGMLNQLNLQKRAITIYSDNVTPLQTPQMIIKLHNVSCSNNFAIVNGVCIHVHMEDGLKQELTVVLDSVTVINNGNFSLFPITVGIVTLKGVTCIINGTKLAPSIFGNNNGVAVMSMNSNLQLNGYVSFYGNRAINGPAIIAEGSSRIAFTEHSTIMFIQNTAMKLGGAIYAVTSEGHYKHCVFDFEKLGSRKFNISFVNNSAKDGGSSIYASPLFNCHLDDSSTAVVHGIQTYYNVFKFISYDSNQMQLDISTLPEKLIGPENINVYPGEEHIICLQAKDFINRSVYASIQVDPPQTGSIRSWLVFKNEDILENSNGTCTNIRLSFYLANTKTITAGMSEQIFFYLQENYNAYLKSSVTMNPCSAGFIFNSDAESCVCSAIFHNFNLNHTTSIADCNFAQQSFRIHHFRSSVSWVGFVNNGTEFALSSNCFIGQCAIYTKIKLVYQSINSSSIQLINDSTIAPINKKLSICVEGREGILCGKCMSGLSVVIGSIQCQKCPSYLNYWLFIVVYLIAGPILIFVIYLLNLTLTTGTVNAVIIYANIININLLYLLYIKNKTSAIELIQIRFIMLLNLKIPFPICVYNGMNQQESMIADVVFPYYLLLIVLVIIIASRYSLWIANKTARSSLQVLVTVVHVSVLTLFSTFMHVFAHATIYTEDGRLYQVWMHDGSIEYLCDPQHVILVIIMSLTVLPLVIIYSFFLTFGKCLLKCRWSFHLKIQHIYETIHAPYKESFQYWFAAKFFLFIAICLVTKLVNINQVYVVITTLVSLFLACFILCRPYKSKVLNVYEISIYTNLLLLYAHDSHGSVSHVYNLPNKQYWLEFSIFYVMCTFTITIVYHILHTLKILCKINSIITTLKKSFPKKERWKTLQLINANDIDFRIPSSHTKKAASSHGTNSSSDSYYSSCKQFREPILGD